MSLAKLNLAELKRAYERNENVTRLLRAGQGGDCNEQSAIQVAYDLQAGSYVAALERPDHRAYLSSYAAALAGVVRPLQVTSILEAGTGEATTLLALIEALGEEAPASISGFDLSWSRIHVASRYWKSQTPRAVSLFVGELEAIPLPANSVDLAFTSHAIEPNHGREREILGELFRVARRHLVLLEPGYEFADEKARARMESHGYCRGLRQIAEELGGRVIEHRLFGYSANPLNPTALLVVEKAADGTPANSGDFACPLCQAPLVQFEGNYFCDAEGLIFPVLRGIPCLLRSQCILGSKYLS